MEYYTDAELTGFPHKDKPNSTLTVISGAESPLTEYRLGLICESETSHKVFTPAHLHYRHPPAPCTWNSAPLVPFMCPWDRAGPSKHTPHPCHNLPPSPQKCHPVRLTRVKAICDSLINDYMKETRSTEGHLDLTEKQRRERERERVWERERERDTSKAPSCTFTFMHLADAFIQSDLQLHSGYTYLFFCIFFCICVPWESNPQPFALLTQCSTTEPHRNTVFSVAQWRCTTWYKSIGPFALVPCWCPTESLMLLNSMDNSHQL